MQLQAILDQAVDILGHLVLDLLLGDLDRIGSLDLQGDGLACQGFEQDLHWFIYELFCYEVIYILYIYIFMIIRIIYILES